MKLTTAKTKRYAILAAKAGAGGLSEKERKEYEGIVVDMAKPEPRRKTKAAAKNPTAAPAKKPAAK